eukprot:6647377-Pyramimonas_sp.AAC.1
MAPVTSTLVPQSLNGVSPTRRNAHCFTPQPPLSGCDYSLLYDGKPEKGSKVLIDGRTVSGCHVERRGSDLHDRTPPVRVAHPRHLASWRARPLTSWRASIHASWRARPLASWRTRPLAIWRARIHATWRAHPLAT